MAKEIKEEDTSSIDRQNIWNKELITILKGRDSQNFNTLLTDHLNSLLDFEQRGNREVLYHKFHQQRIALFISDSASRVDLCELSKDLTWN